MSWWNKKSNFSDESANSQYSNSTDGHGGGSHHETGGKKRSPSRVKNAGGKKAHDEYPGYTANTNDNGDNYNGGTYSGGRYNSYGGGGPYSGNSSSTPYYGGGGYNNSSYGRVICTGGRPSTPYNAPSAAWPPQDSAGRTPMYISTREVHVHGLPGSHNDGEYDNDRRRRGGGGGGGFFGPALHAVGHFVDRKFGFHDRD